MLRNPTILLVSGYGHRGAAIGFTVVRYRQHRILGIEVNHAQSHQVFDHTFDSCFCRRDKFSRRSMLLLWRSGCRWRNWQWTIVRIVLAAATSCRTAILRALRYQLSQFRLYKLQYLHSPQSSISGRQAALPAAQTLPIHSLPEPTL